MFKKSNFKNLLIVFGILLILVLITHFFKNRGNESNFNSKPVMVDTAKVSAIIIKPKQGKDEIKISRAGNRWTIEYKGKNIRPDKQAIEAMLNELINIQADHIAGTDKSDWLTYEVTDTSSIHVRVEQEGKKVTDFLIGKFSYQQNPQKFTSYLRMEGEDEIYAVQGFLSMTFGRGISELRDKTVVDLNPNFITRVTFTYPADSSFVLEKINNRWNIPGMDADSTKSASFVNTLVHLNSYDILPDPAMQGKLLYSVKIEGNNIQPVLLNAFESDTTIKRVITSSLNPDVQFHGTRGDIFRQIFASKKNFAKDIKKKK
jgi:hypothetical protein